MSKKVVVIGGGISGLAISALLGQKGFEVTLLEKNSQIGGKARVFKQKGFTFDMGPSWYLMPKVYQKFFKIFEHKPSDFFKLIKLSTSYRVFVDQKSIDIFSDLQKDTKTFSNLEKSGGEKLKMYLKELEKYYNLALTDFIYQEPSIKSLFKSIKIIKLLLNFNLFISQKFKNPTLKKILSFYTNFLGNTPNDLPAFYSILNYTDLKEGVWYPEGGFKSVVKSLEILCQNLNVKIKLKQEVSKLTITNNKIVNIETHSSKYSADLIINTSDLANFETSIVPKKYQSFSKNYWKTKSFSPKLQIFYLGLNKKIENISHHNLFLENNFSFYLCCPTKTDKKLGPRNCEVLQIIAYEHSKFSDIIQQIEKATSVNISNSIIIKKVFTPKDFQTDYNSYQGSALGLNHTLFQSGPFRPGHKSKKIKNLYYCGQYTNPGVGVPMVLMSAVQTTDLIQKEWII